MWSAGLWVAVGRSVGIGATVVVNFALARFLTPADFGTYGVLLSIITTSSVVAMFGLNVGIVRFLAESLAEKNRDRAWDVLCISFRLAAITGVATSLLVWAGLGIASRSVLEVHNPFLICSLAALAVLLLAANNMQASALRGYDEPRLAIFLGGQHSGGPLGASLFLMLLFTVAWFLPRQLETTVLFYVAAYSVCIPVGAVWLKRTIERQQDSPPEAEPPAFSLPPLAPRAALSVCFPLMLTQVLTLATRESDLWIAGSYAPPDDLPLYVAARRVMQTVAVPLQLVNLSIIALIPTLWSQGRVRELQSALQTAATIACGISGISLLVVMLAPEFVLGLLFGEFYRSAATPLMILCCGQFVFTWTGACELVLLMTGKERLALAVNALSTVMIFLGGPFIAGRWGITGLATLSAAVIAAQNIVQWLLVRKSLGVWTHATARWSRRLR